MLYFGSNIQSSTDVLKRAPVEYLYNHLKHPKATIEAKIRQLRIVRDLDSRSYSALKRELPYFVCASFNPPYRKTENFAYTEFFVLDIDHIGSNGSDIHIIRRKIETDPRVRLSFLSPGEDGLKVLFKLKDRCYDAGIYSLFYKAFSHRISIDYQLDGLLDLKTSDVCRACFVSIDPEAYYNPESVPIVLEDYLDISDVNSMLEMKREFERIEKEDTVPSKHIIETASHDPGKEVMYKIRSLLLGKDQHPKPEVFVPEELDSVLDKLTSLIQDNGLSVTEVSNIQYGKNIKMQLGLKKSELNLFYGKRGFTVVVCPRTGTNPELNALTADLVRSFLNTLI